MAGTTTGSISQVSANRNVDKLDRDVYSGDYDRFYLCGGARARTNTRASEPEKANRSTEQERE
jgi:hypothetical protein